jgi:hypothetical protein
VRKVAVGTGAKNTYDVTTATQRTTPAARVSDKELLLLTPRNNHRVR